MTDQLLLLTDDAGRPLDPTGRHELDYYQTFRRQVGALVRRARFSPGWTYLEPCAGNHAIVRVLREQGLRVWTNDLVLRDEPLDFTLDARRPESWAHMVEQIGWIDVVVTNLPFNEAMRIIEVGFEFVKVGFISLLRSTWDEPVEEREGWLKTHDHLIEQIAMPREKYRGTSDTESATHHWFIAEKIPGLLVPRPIPQGWRTVTRAERDELTAIYGKGH